jgi:hypothetical protein
LMNEIFWPEDYIPGFTDNFVSNEVIVAGLRAMDVWWPFLSKAPLWPTCTTPWLIEDLPGLSDS